MCSQATDLHSACSTLAPSHPDRGSCRLSPGGNDPARRARFLNMTQGPPSVYLVGCPVSRHGGGGGKQPNRPEVACHRVNPRSLEGTKATLAGMIFSAGHVSRFTPWRPAGQPLVSGWRNSRKNNGGRYIYDRSRSTRTDQRQHSHAGDVAVVKRLSPCDRTPSRAHRWAMYSSWVCLFLNALQRNKSKKEEKNQQICSMTFYRGPARYIPLPASTPAQLAREHPPLCEQATDWSLEALHDIYGGSLHDY